MKVTVIATGFESRPSGPKPKTLLTSGVYTGSAASAAVHNVRPPEPLEPMSFAGRQSFANASPSRSPMMERPPERTDMVPRSMPQSYQAPAPRVQPEIIEEPEFEEEIVTEREPAPAPQPAAHQPHIQAPQYAPVQTSRPTQSLPTNRVPTKSEEDDLEIPAFIRKKLM